MRSATVHRLPVEYREPVEAAPGPSLARGLAVAIALTAPLYVLAGFGLGLWLGWWR